MFKNVESSRIDNHYIAKGYVYFAYSKTGYPSIEEGRTTEYIYNDLPFANSFGGAEIVCRYTHKQSRKAEWNGYMLVSDSPTVHGLTIPGGWDVMPVVWDNWGPCLVSHLQSVRFSKYGEEDESVPFHLHVFAGRVFEPSNDYAGILERRAKLKAEIAAE